jgi:hypothetical protein
MKVLDPSSLHVHGTSRMGVGIWDGEQAAAVTLAFASYAASALRTVFSLRWV